MRNKSCVTIMMIVIAAFVSSNCEDCCAKNRIKEQHKYDNASEVVGPIMFVHHFVPPVLQSLQHYVFLQIELEHKAEALNLYQNPSETNETLETLYKDSEVQSLIEQCEKSHVTPDCTDSDNRYRTADGSCNNLKHPRWGNTVVPYERFLPAAYDGISGLRKSVNGEDLPNTRFISLRLKNTTVVSKQVSALFSYYGQSIVHDMTGAPGIAINGSTIPCCDNDTNCRDISISSDDPFYGPLGFTCIPLARTAPYPQCNFDKRNQVNQKTAFIDVSLTYGSDIKEATLMRSNTTSGRLDSQQTEHGEILPKATSEKTLFCRVNQTEKCFLSGDERVNQHTMLMSMQTMLVRLHNIIHDILLELNPQWSGDTVYHESRRIVVALQQHMVFSEYLPFIVGTKNMKRYDLSTHHRSLYDEDTKPNLLIEFVTASFRLHSMLTTEISKFHPEITMDLSYTYNCPLHRGQLGSYVVGSSEVSSEKYDRYFVNAVSDFLNRPPGAQFGTDIAAINIQRGRDNGLPVYVDVVEKCSNGEVLIRDFSDLKQTMPSDSISLLQSIYADVKDIDLWVGMMLEFPFEDSVTGFTAVCISVRQFQRVKFGDSFFYTHRNGRYPFTKHQLKAIQSFSVAQFLCATTNYASVRKHPLQAPSKKNHVVSCDKFSPLDLSAWREEDDENES